MSRLIITGLAIALALLAILTSCCNSSGNTSPYGGPYYIGGVTKKDDMAIAKNAEFIAFNNRKWNSSKVMELKDQNSFEKSIKLNSSSGVPYASEFQRYNYVIKDKKIFVAVWDGAKDLDDICNSGMPYRGMNIKPDEMVNFYPESIGHPPTNLDCISTAGNTKTGVLDAHSKHFMLVQGEGTTISKHYFDWENKTVDYAGEIIVYLTASPCHYVINQGSGTYRPKAGIQDKDDFGNLEAVAQFFGEQIKVSPKSLWRTDTEARIPFTGSSHPQQLSCSP